MVMRATTPFESIQSAFQCFAHAICKDTVYMRKALPTTLCQQGRSTIMQILQA